MVGMSRLHDALGLTTPSRTRHTGGPELGDLGWALGSRTKRRRESRGLGAHLRLGILIGGLVWVAWWIGTSRDQSVDDEPTAAAVTVGGAPAEALEPAVRAVETPRAPDVSTDAVFVPVGEIPRVSAPAPTGPGDVVAAGLADGAQAPPVISAILLSEGRRLAVVEGRVLGAGQRIGSWELVALDRDSVVLRDASGAEQVVPLDHE